MDRANATSGTSSRARNHLWGPDVSGSLGGAGGIGGLLAVEEGRVHPAANTAKLLTVTDGLGNVVAGVSPADGKVLVGFDYGPFGELLFGRAAASTSTPWADALPFRWQTKWDLAVYPPGGTTSLSFLGRWGLDFYDFALRLFAPEHGRFLNRDPIGEQGGANLYAYLGNAPVGRFDYLGLTPDIPRARGYEDYIDYLRAVNIWNAEASRTIGEPGAIPYLFKEGPWSPEDNPHERPTRRVPPSQDPDGRQQYTNEQNEDEDRRQDAAEEECNRLLQNAIIISLIIKAKTQAA